MFKITILVFLFFFVSCVSMHTPTNHFVPSITNKNQFEGEFSVGTALSLSAAYSPIKHLSVMANVQTLPKINSSTFQNCGELAIGFYCSTQKIVFGLNGGMGIGAYNWQYAQANDTMSYNLFTNGQFQKVTLQPFIAFTDNSADPSWFAGFSIKANYFMDQFTSLTYSYEEAPGFVGPKTNLSLEPCFFTRNSFSKMFYIKGQAGLNISYDDSMFWPTQYVFVRVGLGISLGKGSK